MRNTYIITTLVCLLGFLGASNASGAAATVVMLQASTANTTRVNQEKSKDTTSRISCVPQGDPQQQLWTCQDAYGNQYTDLVITLKSEIDRLKNGKNKK